MNMNASGPRRRLASKPSVLQQNCPNDTATMFVTATSLKRNLSKAKGPRSAPLGSRQWLLRHEAQK